MLDDNIHESYTRLAKIGSLQLGIFTQCNLLTKEIKHRPVVNYTLDSVPTVNQVGAYWLTFDEAKKEAQELLMAVLKENGGSFVPFWYEYKHEIIREDK